MKELSDEEIMEILMTSDFNEDLRTQDYKFLIFKFRSFYKILLAKFQNYKIIIESELKNASSERDILKKEKLNSEVINGKLRDIVHLNLKPRKLTWKERITGKVKFNLDDYKDFL